MPPVNQGSRAALVTWTVVTSFLFVTATIFAIYFYVESSRVSTENKDLKAKYTQILPEPLLQGNEVATLSSLKSGTDSPYDNGASLLVISTQRSERLAKKLNGSNNPEAAYANAENALKVSTTKLTPTGFKLQSDNVVGAVGQLTDAVVSRTADAKKSQADADAAVAALKKVQEDSAAQIKSLADQLQEISAKEQQAEANFTTLAQNKDVSVGEIQQSQDAKLKESQDVVNKLSVQVADLKGQLENAKKENGQISDKLREIRPDVNKPVLRQADGRIVRLPGNGVAFIDLGSGDQLINGMTFEVYDRSEGIPPPGDPTNDVGLPRGKASLEVTRVGATSSECRIVATTPGTAMTEGDLVANLVYDKNVKNKFLVYGSFDLNRDGKPTAQDAEVIKRLVTQWGGEVVPDISIDTDFVVLGAEPVIPALTKEQQDDPIQKAIYDKAVADAQAYNDISNKARDYRIPVLNQNRFLYMVGYFELSKR